MPNSATGNPIFLDTVGEVLASSSIVHVRKLIWASATGAGHLARLEPMITSTGSLVFWQGVFAATSTMPQVVDFNQANTGQNWGEKLLGLRVATLSSGFILLYRS